jgi:hypothetical protein
MCGESRMCQKALQERVKTELYVAQHGPRWLRWYQERGRQVEMCRYPGRGLFDGEPLCEMLKVSDRSTTSSNRDRPVRVWASRFQD